MQYKPGVRGALADAAVDNRLIFELDVRVNLLKLFAVAETRVRVNGLIPWNVYRGWNVATTQDAFLWVIDHVGSCTGILLRSAHVDNRSLSNELTCIAEVGAQCLVVALDDRVVSAWVIGDLEARVSFFSHPGIAATVKQAHVGMPKKLEDPECVGGPPVGLVAVDYDGVIARDALLAHELGKAFGVDIVAAHGIVKVVMPVDANRARNMSNVVEQ